jgi:hypothetical protein
MSIPTIVICDDNSIYLELSGIVHDAYALSTATVCLRIGNQVLY